LEEALAALADDLRHTYLADIAPGPGYRDGERLRLVRRGDKPLLVPYYVPATAEQRNLTILANGDAQARRTAAEQLAEAPSRTALRGLAEAIEEDEGAPLLEPFGRAAASLLLHGDAKDQEAALDAAERAVRHGPPLPAVLIAALRVYPKMAPPEGRARRARVLSRAPEESSKKRQR
jgi:hypothetical protein